MHLSEYIRRIDQETDSSYDSVYRGHGDRIWGLESAAYRRLKRNLNKERPNTDDHINYNMQLLEAARLKGLHQRGFRELCDLELLAELQHLGAATCLMDFTWNAGVALWFAAREHPDKDGAVIVLDINHSHSYRVSTRELNIEADLRTILSLKTRPKADFSHETDAPWPIESSLLTEHHWYWTPEGLNSRIQKQDSVFVFNGSGVWPEPFSTIPVRRKDKVSLLDELGDLLNISEESLFGDIHGFAQLHGAGRQ